MNAAIVIPARYASTRLPGKPLLRETGKYLIQHVVEAASRSKLAREVIVATDDDRIADAVASFGGRATMTRADHASGTDRIAEVALRHDADVFVNVQGDEPQLEASAIDGLIALLRDDDSVGLATLATPIRQLADYENPNIVKVVCDDSGKALYFSRCPIPYVRDGRPDFAEEPAKFLQHLGVYAYRREVLLRLAATLPHPLEQSEQLEQLRALAHGIGIKVGIIPRGHKGIDTPADYAAFVEGHRVDGTGSNAQPA